MEPKWSRQGLRAYLDANYQPPRLESYKIQPASTMREPDCAPMAPRKSGTHRQAEKKAPSRWGLRELLQNTDAGFTETLLRLIDRSGKKDPEIYTRANLSRQHFSKIRNNPGYRPTKSTALALAIALELNLTQTQDLIGRAGYTLTRSSEFDLIVMYFIEQKHYDLNDINEALYEYDQSLLGM